MPNPTSSCPLSVLNAWRAIQAKVVDHDLGQALSRSLRSSQYLQQAEVLVCLAHHCLQSNDVSEIAWILTTTSLSSTLNRSSKAALVLNHPALLPHLCRSLDHLPIMAELRQSDTVPHPNLVWVLSTLSPESLTSHFNDIVPVLAAALNPTRIEQRISALSAFQIVLRKVDLAVLRWQSGLILELLRREVQIRDVKDEDVAVETYLQALIRLLPRQRPRGPEIDAAIELVRCEINYLALGGTYPTSNPNRWVLFLSASRTLFALLGTQSVVHLQSFLPALLVFMEHERDDIKRTAIAVLQMLIRVCWPQIPLHCGKLFEGICRAVIKHTIVEGSDDTLRLLIDTLSLVRQTTPSRFHAIASSCDKVEIIGDVLRKVARTDILLNRYESLVSWDDTFVYSKLIKN